MKTNDEQTDSSTSEDEMSTDILKEVIDPQFSNDNLYTTRKDKFGFQSDKSNIYKSNRKTLRDSWKQENTFTNFGVTSSFQTFIAKKLGEILERTIKESKHDETTDRCVKLQQSKNENSGIKLLSSSEDFLTTAEVYTKYNMKSEKRKKRRKLMEGNDDYDDDSAAISKLREIAIDPEYILSKSATKAWTNRRSEAEFKYKRLKDGTLVEQR